MNLGRAKLSLPLAGSNY